MAKIIKNPLFIVIFTIFLDSLGFGILIPIVPLLFASPSSNFYLLSPDVSINTGYVLLGLITATFPLMQLFSTSIFGQLSDKFGRKPILQYTLFNTSFSYVLFALAIAVKNIPLLFISRAMAGISAGNISVAQASIADLTLPKDRAKNFGLIGAAFGLGFIIGPFLGGKLSDPTILPFFNPTIPFWFAAALSLLNAFSVKTFYKETNKFSNIKSKIEWGRSIANIFKAFSLENLRFLFLINFLFFSGFTFFVTFFSVFLIKQFHFTQGDIGTFFSFIGICLALTQVVIVRKVAGLASEQQILRISIIANGIFIGLMYFVSSPLAVYLLAAGFSLFNGLVFANLPGLISRSADQKIQGEILGINASVQALAQLIPPVLSGFLAAIFAPETPIIVASVIVIFSGVLFTLFYKPSKSTAHIENY
jgi:MFS transporter, DHA1 family, tetracycline resistance protein